VKTEWFVRERERERERERAMIINKANKHLTPQIIEHKPIKEISLFWEYTYNCGGVRSTIRNYPLF
jgi:hypothetical protein